MRVDSYDLDMQQRVIKRPLRLVLGFLVLILAVILGGVLGAAFGIWAAALWDAAVIVGGIFAIRQWALMRTKEPGGVHET